MVEVLIIITPPITEMEIQVVVVEVIADTAMEGRLLQNLVPLVRGLEGDGAVDNTIRAVVVEPTVLG